MRDTAHMVKVENFRDITDTMELKGLMDIVLLRNIYTRLFDISIRHRTPMIITQTDTMELKSLMNTILHIILPRDIYTRLFDINTLHRTRMIITQKHTPIRPKLLSHSNNILIPTVINQVNYTTFRNQSINILFW